MKKQLAVGAAFVLLVALTVGVFLAVHHGDSVISGRDCEYHTLRFFNYAYQWTDHKFPTAYQYGPLLPLATFPLWALLGPVPEALCGTNLLVFLALLVLLALTLRRLETDPAWIALLGTILAMSPLGFELFSTYNLDTLTVLAVMIAFHVMIAPSDTNLRNLPALCAVILFCTLVRPTTLIYLAVPILYQAYLFATDRPSRTTGQSGGGVAWVVLALLMVANAIYYGHKIPDIVHHLTTHHDFSLDNTRYVAGLWTVENWTWFFRRLPETLHWALWFALAPLALFGWMRVFPTRAAKAAGALFLFFPLVVFSFILGTRYVQYIAPSIVLFVLLAVVGISRISKKALQAVAIVIVVALGAMFTEPINFSNQPTGYYELAPRLFQILDPDKRIRSVGVINLDDHLLYEANIMAAPLFADAPARFELDAWVPSKALGHVERLPYDLLVVISGIEGHRYAMPAPHLDFDPVKRLHSRYEKRIDLYPLSSWILSIYVAN